jgi:hypothetical protein
MELAAYIAATCILAGLRLWRRDTARALAYCAVLMGLLTMAAIRGPAEGIVAFSVWTLVSYSLRNFPLATTVYLGSAFCYMLELQGAAMLYLQLASNALGVLGLVAIWYGQPRWQYIPPSWIGFSRPLSLGDDIAARSTGPQETDKEAA